MYHRRIWHASVLIAGSALSLCLVVSADLVSQISAASELAFAPAGSVRPFLEGWYTIGAPVGVGVWSFRLAGTVPIHLVASPMEERLTASVYQSADAVEAM